jgi:hypothetical protein
VKGSNPGIERRPTQEAPLFIAPGSIGTTEIDPPINFRSNANTKRAGRDAQFDSPSLTRWINKGRMLTS